MKSLYSRPPYHVLRPMLHRKMFALLRLARARNEPGYPEGTDRWSKAARKLADALHTLTVEWYS